MDDFFKYVIGALIGLIVIGFLVVTGAEVQGDGIRNDCKNFGKFKWGDEIFECSPVPDKQEPK